MLLTQKPIAAPIIIEIVDNIQAVEFLSINK
jgi:hypothetical protein